MGLQLPEGLMQAMQQQHAAQPPRALQPDPLEVLGACIQHLHDEVIPNLPDPGDTNQAVRALGILTGIQQRLASQGQSGPQQAG